MTQPPPSPTIFHITHVDNLPSILADGRLVSDAEMIRRGGTQAAIGMAAIKRRRVEKLDVACHPGTKVGDFVPFHFCPRSVMLYVIYRHNKEELAYREGQDPIVHLEADLHDVVAWADAAGRRWAFSLSNAGSKYAEFRNRVDQLSELDWAAIANRDFRGPETKERKQAEFLMYGDFPWTLVRRVGVHDAAVLRRASDAIAAAAPTSRPPVEILPDWYY